MGCRIFVGHEAGVGDGGFGPNAVLFCSTTGWAFGPIFSGHDEAEAFLNWLERNGWNDPASPVWLGIVRDPRQFSDDEQLRCAVTKFRETDDAN